MYIEKFCLDYSIKTIYLKFDPELTKEDMLLNYNYYTVGRVLIQIQQRIRSPNPGMVSGQNQSHMIF